MLYVTSPWLLCNCQFVLDLSTFFHSSLQILSHLSKCFLFLWVDLCSASISQFLLCLFLYLYLFLNSFSSSFSSQDCSLSQHTFLHHKRLVTLLSTFISILTFPGSIPHPKWFKKPDICMDHPLFQNLQWLPIILRLKFKIFILPYWVQYSLASVYLSSLVL